MGFRFRCTLDDHTYQVREFSFLSILQDDLLSRANAFSLVKRLSYLLYSIAPLVPSGAEQVIQDRNKSLEGLENLCIDAVDLLLPWLKLREQVKPLVDKLDASELEKAWVAHYGKMDSDLVREEIARLTSLANAPVSAQDSIIEYI